MATEIQRIIVEYEVNDAALEELRALIKAVAKEAGITEDQFEKINDTLNKNVQATKQAAAEQQRLSQQVKDLTRTASQLKSALSKATDPADQKKLQAELDKTEKKLKEVEVQAKKIPVTI